MNKARIPIPKDISEQLLYQNRHTCSICHEFRKHVQIHHIDSNPSNNDIENLSVLCLDCHSLVTGNEGLGRSYSPQEVIKYKSSWEILCGKWLEGENSINENEDETIDSDYLDDLLEADTHIDNHYELEKGEGILLWMKSDEPIYVAIMRKSDYKNWLKRKITLQDAYELLLENVTEKKEMFIADEDDEYSVVIANFSSENTWIQADISIWEFE
jgi:hypothetical protein